MAEDKPKKSKGEISADDIAHFIRQKAEQHKVDVDQITLTIEDGDKLQILGFYYMNGGEQFHIEEQIALKNVKK